MVSTCALLPASAGKHSGVVQLATGTALEACPSRQEVNSQASWVHPEIKADPQAKDKAERCTVFARKLCEHAGKLGMPQATDKAERLCCFCSAAM